MKAELNEVIEWSVAQVAAGKGSVYPDAKNILHLETLITAASECQALREENIEIQEALKTNDGQGGEL